MSETIISMRGVNLAFEDNVIYEGMNLDIQKGETLTILGGSGSGKSVCLKLMIGLLLADAGEVLFEGREIGDMRQDELREVRQRVAMVFQGGALFDSMSVLQNVSYALREHTDMSDGQMRDRSAECLEMVGLGPSIEPGILGKMPASLSGGMRKRVALARSIALKPDVILYDEPTTGLDPPNCDRIARMIRQLQRELKVTSVVVTHDIATAWHVSDRVAMLYEDHFPFTAEVDDFRRIEDPVVKEFIERRAS